MDYGNSVTNENYYALALAVYEKLPSGKALWLMGIAPDREPVIIEDCGYKNMSVVVYVLHKICGIQQKMLAPMLNISKGTLRRALVFCQKGGPSKCPSPTLPM